MAKQTLNVNSQKFLGTHFHIVNELERFIENSTVPKNTSHHFVTTASPLMFAVIAMNENILKFTLNVPLIIFLKQTTKYFKETLEELEKIYKECNDDFKSDSFANFVEKTLEINKKTVADLRKASATNNLEKLHLINLKIVLISIRNIALTAMQLKECLKLSPLICDLDISTKAFILKLERFLKA